MKHQYSLIYQFIVRFLLISTVLQSCDTPPNPPTSPKENYITYTSIPFEELTDKQLISKEENIDVISHQLKAEENEQEASKNIQASLDLAVAQGLKQDEVSKAGTEDIALSTYSMARLYEQGKGIEEDLELALALYTKASNLGHQKAAYHAGKLHLFGRTSKSDVRKAYEFLEKASKVGIYKACLLLGRIHEYGWGTVPNPTEALTWYAQASLSLNKNSYSRGIAFYHLGWLYKLGRGVIYNEATALSFFEQALIIGQGSHTNQTTRTYNQRIEDMWREETPKTLLQILKEISYSGEYIVKELENENAHLVLNDKADLALLVHHPLFKKNCKSIHLVNQIGNIGLIVEFAKYLQGTCVHTINLRETEMSDEQVVEFAKNLQGTSVHTINLGENKITSLGAIGLAKHLQGSKVQELDLGWNKIGNLEVVEFAKNLQGTNVHTINLANNGVDDEVAVNFASHLQGTNVHKVELSENPIGLETRNILIQQYPNITWIF
ncbi:MAG: hypothetical protein ACYC2U_08525 [Candidatus Amoebophilus sp.]